MKHLKNGKFISLVPDDIWQEIEKDLRLTTSVEYIIQKFSTYLITKEMIYEHNHSKWNINLKAAQKGKRLNKNRRFSDTEELSMVDLYTHKNLSSPQIGKLFNCDPSTVCRILKHNQITIKDGSSSKRGKMPTGKNHPQYIDGRSKTLPHGYRLTTEYRHWRKTVFIRDNYTCQICNIRSGKGIEVKLNADHILPQSLFPELRYDTNNGRTLCHSCHVKTDTYGTKVKKLTCADFISNEL